MKKFTLLFVILLANYAFSQKYAPFSSKGSWNVVDQHSILVNDQFKSDTLISRYFLSGDTLIDNNRYVKLNVENINPASSPRTIGALREDNKRVYYRGEQFGGGQPFGSDYEFVLYDFNKQIGDTIFHDSYHSVYSVIKGIDSVQIDLSYRKRYQIESNNIYDFPEEYWIEGIGNVNSGLLGSITQGTTCMGCQMSIENICYKEDDNVLYLNPKYADCSGNKVTKGIKEINNSKITVIYDKNSKKLFLTNDSSEGDLSIQIIDLNGNIVRHRMLAEGKSSIDLPKNGLLNVVVYNKNNKVVFYKKIL